MAIRDKQTVALAGIGLAAVGREAPLQNLSRNCYNLALRQEKEPASAHLAHNRCDKFLSAVGYYVGIGSAPTDMKAYGWLDASLSSRLNGNISLSIGGLDLTRTVRQSSWDVESRPRDTWINDRQIGATVTIRF